MTQIILEQVTVYGVVILLCFFTVFFYLRKQKRNSKEILKKVALAKEEGLFDPISVTLFPL